MKNSKQLFLKDKNTMNTSVIDIIEDVLAINKAAPVHSSSLTWAQLIKEIGVFCAALD